MARIDETLDFLFFFGAGVKFKRKIVGEICGIKIGWFPMRNSSLYSLLRSKHRKVGEKKDVK